MPPIATATPASDGNPRFSASGETPYEITSDYCDVRVWWTPVKAAPDVTVVAGTNQGRIIRQYNGYRFHCRIVIPVATRAEALALYQVCNWIVAEGKAVTLRPWSGNDTDYDTVVLLESAIGIEHPNARKMVGTRIELEFIGKDVTSTLPESITGE